MSSNFVATTVAPGGEYKFTLTFTSGKFSIANNDSDENPYDVTILTGFVDP